MKSLVKICGLTHMSSVEAAIAAGADAVGFVFSESPRKVTTRHAAFIANRVPRNVLRVAVTRHPSVELWREVETIFCPDVLQTDAEDFDYLDVSPDIVHWPVVREGMMPSADVFQDVFVYEGAASGRGEQVDWQIAGEMARKGRMILAGGLDCNNVAAAIRTVSPYGVDVSSGIESAPGVKDADLIHAFVAAVRDADGRLRHESLRTIVENAVEDAAKDDPR